MTSTKCHVSLLLQMAEVIFQDLAQHQCGDCDGSSSGSASLLKQGKKMEMLERTFKRNKRPKTEEFECKIQLPSVSSFTMHNMVYPPEKRNGNQSCTTTCISPVEIAFTRSNSPHERSDFQDQEHCLLDRTEHLLQGAHLRIRRVRCFTLLKWIIANSLQTNCF